MESFSGRRVSRDCPKLPVLVAWGIRMSDRLDTRTRSRAPALLAIWGTVLFWGLSFVASKTILNTGVPPMTMVTIRFVVATVILNAFLHSVDPGARLRLKDVIPLLASGLCGVTIYFFFESRGIKLTSASHASIIIAVIPVVTVAAEALFYRTRVSWLVALGIGLSVIGTVFVVGRPAPGRLAGDLFMFGACGAWVAYIFLTRKLHDRLSDIAITAYQSLFGTVFLIPLCLLESSQWVPITPLALMSLVYLALFCSALSNFLYVVALSRLGPISVSPYLNMIPVVGVLGGVILLGESIAWTQVLGGVVVLGGVLLVNRKQQPAGPPAEG